MRRWVSGFFSFWLFTSSTFASVQSHSLQYPMLNDERRIREVSVRFIEVSGIRSRSFCSGVMIGVDEVLSADHCFSVAEGRRFRGSSVFAEIYDAKSLRRRIRIPIAEIRSNPHERADLALVKLAFELPIRASIPIASSGCDSNSEYISAGFGIDESGASSDSLKMTRYELMSDEQMNRIQLNSELVGQGNDPNLLSLVSVAGRNCGGDSGGPIFCRVDGVLSLVAINSTITHLNQTLKSVKRSWPMYCGTVARFQFGTYLPTNFHRLESLRDKKPVSDAQYAKKLSLRD